MRHKTYARKKRQSKHKRVVPYALVALLLAVITVGSSEFLHVTFRQETSPPPPPITVPSQSLNTAIPPPPAPPTPQQPAHDYTIPPVQNGMVPVISRIPTKEPVVFLTIDDGITQLPGNLAAMQANHDVATFFLVYRFIKNNPSYFVDLSKATGSDIENHTYDHYLQTGLSYVQQQQDICKGADTDASLFGRRPILFRPPGGAYNTDTQKAAAVCGMQALIMWDATVNNGSLQYQRGRQLQPGDVVLMHFRTTFTEDMNAFVAAEKQARLHTDLLENWLPPTTPNQHL